MKRYILLFVVMAGMFLQACSKDNDDELGIETAEAALYELTVINNTGVEVEIYLMGTSGDNEYESQGNLAAGSELLIPNLSVRQTYGLRAAYPGDTVEDHFYEEIFNRTSPTNLELEITVGEE